MTKKAFDPYGKLQYRQDSKVKKVELLCDLRDCYNVWDTHKLMFLVTMISGESWVSMRRANGKMYEEVESRSDIINQPEEPKTHTVWVTLERSPDGHKEAFQYDARPEHQTGERCFHGWELLDVKEVTFTEED